jgi:thiazole synthase
MPDPLIIAGREFRSRLIVGTEKYKSFQETARALEASGAEIVTVAVRRVNLDRSQESLLDYITTSIPRNIFCCPTRPGVTRPRKPSAPPAWGAKSGFLTG